MLLLALGFAGACARAPLEPEDAGSADASALVCTVQAPRECPDPAPRFGDIQPILDSRCGSCHTGKMDEPWPLTDYQDIVDWRDAIRIDLINCTMPPVDGGVSMTNEERARVLIWIRCGFLP